MWGHLYKTQVTTALLQEGPPAKNKGGPSFCSKRDPPWGKPENRKTGNWKTEAQEKARLERRTRLKRSTRLKSRARLKRRTKLKRRTRLKPKKEA